MKLLITGGLGFIGSNLVDSLSKKNHKIKILTKTFSKKSNIKNSYDKVEIEKINLTNFKRLGQIIEKFKPDIIIHLAGNTSHSKSFEEPLEDIDSNSKTTLFMLEKIRELRLSCKFVLGSTFIVIGKPTKLPVTESTPCNPTTIYGTNKLASEHFCKIYHDVYGLDTVIFRITNSYGPREQVISTKNAVNFLIYEASNRKEISIYNKGKFFRDFIYIDDVVSGINVILKKGKSGELYWISSGKKTWFYEFANILEKNTNCKVVYPKTPTYTKKVDVGNFIVNNAKLRKLGWSPKISINVGIKKTLDYFQSN
ncbi:GDP-mannose 4,6-dehydratase [Marine Group I thaumarchaeote]|uniref:GDP-mannose 4,6-dehydratase n=1 Tax=Marine Group I thaumarchaeote TaxID=2511932 RepID=A0A7K4NTT9_9ARCH|nr:GDP-mannose 4,6-dehydratase [Marine Group I thaumarchaeote]